MRLEFSRIILTDFKEYRGKHALDLSGLGFGLHYIRGVNRVDALGSNGAGKSTLWDAFMWCLSGRTVRGLRGTDVRTWGSERQAMCRVDFYRGDRAHWVRRSTVKNGLWLDGKLTSQEEIDRLLGLSIINLPHTLILGQKQELFFDLKPQAKLEILSETLNLDRWTERSTRARNKTNELETEYSSVNFQIVQLEKNKATNLGLIAELRDKGIEWEDARFKDDDKRERAIAKLAKALEQAVTDKGTHDLAYDSAETELRAVRRDILKKQGEMDGVLDDISKTRTKRDTAKARYDELRELAGSDICPTCGQSIAGSKSHAQRARSDLADAKKRWQIASDRVIVHETRKELLRDVMVRMRESEDTFAAKSDDAKDKLDQHQARCSDIEKQIAVLKAQTREAEVNPYSEALAQARKRVKECKASIAENKEQSDLLSRRITRMRYWIDGFKQVRLYLLQETLEELQEVTQNMLPEFGLPGWTVEYAIERETKKGGVSTGLTVTILKPGMDKAVRWEAWSGGEGQRLLIVGAIALSEVLLRRAGIECDMLVLDEATRHCSVEGVRDIVEFLLARAKDSQVFFVDHTVVESDRFASVITIEKNKDGAHVKVH